MEINLTVYETVRALRALRNQKNRDIGELKLGINKAWPKDSIKMTKERISTTVAVISKFEKTLYLED